MITQGDWESVGVAVQGIKDPVFYHADVVCDGTIRVARSSGVGEELALGNAALIAAAPKLLAAAMDVVKTVTPDKLRGTVKINFSEQVALSQLSKAIEATKNK